MIMGAFLYYTVDCCVVLNVQCCNVMYSGHALADLPGLTGFGFVWDCISSSVDCSAFVCEWLFKPSGISTKANVSIDGDAVRLHFWCGGKLCH